MKKRILIAVLACTAIMYSSISVGMPSPSTTTEISHNFEHEVPHEWLERDSDFNITAPSSGFDSDFSLIQGFADDDIRYVPIPDQDQDNNDGQTVVPIPNESANNERGIMNIIPIG